MSFSFKKYLSSALRKNKKVWSIEKCLNEKKTIETTAIQSDIKATWLKKCFSNILIDISFQDFQ